VLFDDIISEIEVSYWEQRRQSTNLDFIPSWEKQYIFGAFLLSIEWKLSSSPVSSWEHLAMADTSFLSVSIGCTFSASFPPTIPNELDILNNFTIE